MNSFLISAITICLAAQCAIAQYQSGPSYGSGYQQRKMAPTPQTYGQQAGGYGGEQQSYESAGGYEQPTQSYKAPSSASVSQYDERTPTSSGYGAAKMSYGKQQASGYGAQQQSGYGAQQQQSGYGAQQSGYGSQQAASNYAKPAPKYEEPYHPPMPFAWGYDINDGYGGAQYHKENGDEYGKRTGSYGYTDAYGIYRQVDYVADENGFRATIKTNEPGTANESPADVELHAYEPPSNYYAGNTNSYSAQAAPAKSSYGSSASNSYNSGANSQSSYGAQATSYSAPRASMPQQQQQQQSAYGGGAQRSSYSSKQSGGYGAQAMRAYEPSAQYSSSSMVPVYQKAGKVAAVAAPAKRVY